MTGKDPFPYEIDHKNLIKNDDSWENLRLATRSDNARNRNSNRKILLKGVSISSKKFRSRIKVNNRHICLGTFLTEKEAHEAYCDAAKKYHKEFANFT